MKKVFLMLLICCLSFLLVYGCTDDSSDGQQKILLITMGDSLSHGVENYGQSRDTQLHSFPNQLGNALKNTFGENRVTFYMPLMNESGVSKEEPTRKPTNLGVGSSLVHHVYDTSVFGSDTPDGMTSTVAMFMSILYAKCFPSTYTQLDAAIDVVQEYYPGDNGMTIINLWIGGNDFLTLMDGTGEPTPYDQFIEDYETIVSRLLAETPPNTYIVLVAVPDVSAVGTEFKQDELHFFLDGLDSQYTDLINGLNDGETINGTTSNYPMIKDIIAYHRAGDMASMEALFNNQSKIVTEAERQNARDTLTPYNAWIEDRASQDPRLFYADLFEAMLSINQTPEVVGEYSISAKWGPRGKFFSLDGIHPAETGNALIVNYLLEEYNRIFGWEVPPVDVESIVSQDPYAIDEDNDGFMPPLPYKIIGLPFDFAFDSNDNDPSITPFTD